MLPLFLAAQPTRRAPGVFITGRLLASQINGFHPPAAMSDWTKMVVIWIAIALTVFTYFAIDLIEPPRRVTGL
jgi:hypothetical protein